jgi:hypothetical protein
MPQGFAVGLLWYAPWMATAVFLRLRDGRTVRFGHARDAASAAKVKNDVETWVSAGITLSVANARGTIEDVTPSSVEIVELCSEPTPMLGSPVIPAT